MVTSQSCKESFYFGQKTFPIVVEISKKIKLKNMVKKKTITIDYQNAIKNAKSEEAKIKALSVINDYGFSDQTRSNWKKKAPAQVAFLSDLSDALGVPMNDFIKKI